MMSLVSLLDWSLKSAVLLLACFAAAACFGRHVRLRRMLWVSALLVIFALPLLRFGQGSPVGVPIVREVADGPSMPLSLCWLVWVAGASTVALRVLIGQIALKRAVRGVQLLELDLAFLPSAACGRRIEVYVSRRPCGGPFTFGLLRPRILLPKEARSWTPERMRVVMLHELAHVRSLDNVSLWLCHFLSALQWLNPLVWLAARALRNACEESADAAVIEGGIRRSEYASLLLTLASGRGSLVASSVFPMAQRPLERRIRNVVRGSEVPRLKRRHVAGLGIGLLVVATTLGSIRLAYSQESHSAAWLEGFALGRAHREGKLPPSSLRTTGLTPEEMRDLELSLIRDRPPPQ